MGNFLTTTTVSKAFGIALTQVQIDAMEFVAQGLSISLAVMGIILAVTIGAKAFKRFAK